MSQADPLRALLFIEALIAFLLYAHLVGKLWRGMWRWRGRALVPPRPLLWALRTTWVGFGGLLLYATSGQIKAVQRESPFDLYSWTGLLSVTVINVGVAWLIREQQRHERG